MITNNRMLKFPADLFGYTFIIYIHKYAYIYVYLYTSLLQAVAVMFPDCFHIIVKASLQIKNIIKIMSWN